MTHGRLRFKIGSHGSIAVVITFKKLVNVLNSRRYIEINYTPVFEYIKMNFILMRLTFDDSE